MELCLRRDPFRESAPERVRLRRFFPPLPARCMRETRPIRGSSPTLRSLVRLLTERWISFGFNARRFIGHALNQGKHRYWGSVQFRLAAWPTSRMLRP
jgi:hypothetical protein